MLRFSCEKSEGAEVSVFSLALSASLPLAYPLSAVTPAARRGRAEHKALLQTHQKDQGEKNTSWANNNPSHCRCTLMQRRRRIGNGNWLCDTEREERNLPFFSLKHFLPLSSSIVSLWGSPFRGIHASAFEPQWPPLYKLSALVAWSLWFILFPSL